MAWFPRLCRQLGLTIHDIVKPVSRDAASNKQPSSRETVSHKVEEQKINEKVTLRRTTIEEVEIKRDEDDNDTSRG